MILVPSLLVLAIAAGVLPSAEAGQKARPDPVAATQPDYILQTCGETESTGDPRSAMRAVDPAYMLKNYLYLSSNGKIIADLASIRTTLLQGTQHGNLLSSLSNTGRTTFHYDATPDYLGNDKAIFMAEFEGKVYKIALELHVFNYTAPGNFGDSTCPAPTLVKVNAR
jgi:hypothetical protein